MTGLSAALVLLLCYFTLKCCSAIDTITATQFLKDPGTLTSKNKTFTLGFFSPPNSTKRYIGIWYTKPSVRDVVWVANNNNPLWDSSGLFKISKDGNLQVLNGVNQMLWSSNVSSFLADTNLTAQLLDSGNLVLISKGDVIWQSSDHPTDTVLPNIKFTSRKGEAMRKVLRSWRSLSDPSDGQFTADVDTFTLPQLVVWNRDRLHWRSGPWNGQIFIGIQFNFTNFINAQLVVSSDKQGTITTTYLYPNQSLQSAYKLSIEGKMTQIWWDDAKRSWEVEWQQPATECDLYGRCGAFGTCNSQRPVICECLKGFKPLNKERWNKGDWSGGCVRQKKLQCENGNGKEDGFLTLKMMKVPDHAESRLGLNPEGCRSRCLSNCSCFAYTYSTCVGCLTWSTNLVDIQEFSVGGVDLYLRLAHSELGNNNKVMVIAVVVGSLLTGTALIALLSCLLRKQRAHRQAYNKKMKQDVHTTSPGKSDVKFEELPLFNFERLAVATNNFNDSNKLGRGGFGTVYKGKLEDGQEIAVKRLSRASGQGIEEFVNEAMVISKLQHRNLVRLVGCCVEAGEKILVYEYMPNKSLDKFLFAPEKQNVLDWKKRFNIIEGICRGLQYLHNDSRLKIIHRDLKASNILLDNKLDPKISDFGMARIFRWEQDQADTKRVVGTYGYMSPEYAMEGQFSEKSDVFSFGVLLLEIISGKRNSIFSDNEQSLSLLGYAWKLWNEKNVTSLFDPFIAQPNYEEDILRCVQVGLLCVQEFAKDRPNISAVISMLNGEVSDLPHPNRPGFGQISNITSSSQENQQDLSANYVSITETSGR